MTTAPTDDDEIAKVAITSVPYPLIGPVTDGRFPSTEKSNCPAAIASFTAGPLAKSYSSKFTS